MSVRRVVGAVVGLMCVALLSSCSLLPSSLIYDKAQQQSNVPMQQIAAAVNNHDAAALKKMFSPRAREKASDLDKGLKYFLSFFAAGHMSWHSEGTGITHDDEYKKQTVELYALYKVEAGGKQYEMFFADFPVNQVDDPHNVGIYALGVAPYVDYGYTAAGKPKPFYTWTESFRLDRDKTYGAPGVYVPGK